MNDVRFRKWDLITDYIIQLIKSSMIPLNGTHCNKQKVSCVLKHFHLKLVWSIWLRKSLLCLRRKLYHLFQTHSNVLQLETNRISKSNNCLMLTISFFLSRKSCENCQHQEIFHNGWFWFLCLITKRKSKWHYSEIILKCQKIFETWEVWDNR